MNNNKGKWNAKTTNLVVHTPTLELLKLVKDKMYEQGLSGITNHSASDLYAYGDQSCLSSHGGGLGLSPKERYEKDYSHMPMLTAYEYLNMEIEVCDE